jgi:hypothetical protein
VSSITSTEALAERCRGTACALPSSIWASTGQIEPGRYLPSWPMNRILAAAPADSGEPRDASSCRHIWDVMTRASRTLTSAAATERKPRWPSAAAICAQSLAIA